MKQTLCTAHMFQGNNSKEERDALILKRWRLFAGNTTINQQTDNKTVAHLASGR